LIGSLQSLLGTVVIAVFVITFIVQAFQIPSESMMNTLLVGDYLLVNKLCYGGRGLGNYLMPYQRINRGDIIVFHYPVDPQQHFVKRVIGLPGDRVKVVDQEVYVNGKLLSEPYVVHDPAAHYDPLNYNFPPLQSQMIASGLQPEWAHEMKKFTSGGEIIVPQGKYFAMGDNRDQSWDSRFWGFVDHDAIMGRPFLIYWSVEAKSSDYSGDSTFWSRLTGVLDTLAHLPTRTRWSRMLHTVH